ncbi:MAG: carbohydrate-binding domain-containing protein [Ruminococcaceae bacterium]|nr:carbohydrate-binding domain-containing protein [Oscillospiraceae bacterium]
MLGGVIMKNILSKILCFCLTLCLIFMLFACDNDNESSSSSSSESESSEPSSEGATPTYTEAVTIFNSDDMFTDRDKNPSYDSSATVITLNGENIECESSDVLISGGQITISAGGDYIIRGSALDASIVVNASSTDKVCLVLDGANISTSEFASIFVKKAKKVFVLVKGSCSLSSVGEFVDRDIGSAGAVIYSKEDITLQGDGSLTISTEHGHGIESKGNLKISSLSLTVNASSHAICAKDSIRTLNSNLNLTAGKDAIHAESQSVGAGYIYCEGGQMTITSGFDALDGTGAISVDNVKMVISSGMAVSGSSSMKGFKSDDSIAILSGDVSINSSDDGIHSGDSVLIAGGKLSISCSDDAIHADQTIFITGGDTSVTKSYEGLEGQRVVICSGKLKINANDDGINAGGGNDSSGQNDEFDQSVRCSIDISGGEIYVNAKGDGVDSNGTISVSGGITIVEGPTNNKNGPFDYDLSASVTGGIFVAIGSPGMAMNFSKGTQGAILHNFENTAPASSELKIYDGDTLILSHISEKQFVSVLVSAPSFKVGGTYKIVAGEQSVEITLSELIHNKGYHSGMIK